MSEKSSIKNPIGVGVIPEALAAQESQRAVIEKEADDALVEEAKKQGFALKYEGEVLPALYYEGVKVVSGSRLAEASEVYAWETEPEEREKLKTWAESVISAFKEDAEEYLKRCKKE
jgi:hypothetical protein